MKLFKAFVLAFFIMLPMLGLLVWLPHWYFQIEAYNGMDIVISMLCGYCSAIFAAARVFYP